MTTNVENGGGVGAEEYTGATGNAGSRGGHGVGQTPCCRRRVGVSVPEVVTPKGASGRRCT